MYTLVSAMWAGNHDVPIHGQRPAPAVSDTRHELKAEDG
jgi:hypothetical protein